jgi:hypothetical protein
MSAATSTSQPAVMSRYALDRSPPPMASRMTRARTSTSRTTYSIDRNRSTSGSEASTEYGEARNTQASIPTPVEITVASTRLARSRPGLRVRMRIA